MKHHQKETKIYYNAIKPLALPLSLKLHFIFHTGFHTFLFILVLSIWWHIKTMWILFLKPVFQEVIHMPYLWSGLALISAIFRLDILRKPKYVFFPIKGLFQTYFFFDVSSSFWRSHLPLQPPLQIHFLHYHRFLHPLIKIKIKIIQFDSQIQWSLSMTATLETEKTARWREVGVLYDNCLFFKRWKKFLVKKNTFVAYKLYATQSKYFNKTEAYRNRDHWHVVWIKFRDLLQYQNLGPSIHCFSVFEYVIIVLW